MKTAPGIGRFGCRVAFVASVACIAGCVEPTRLEQEWEVLGRPASAEVWATTERAARGLLDEFPVAMEQVAAAMSAARPGSELNRLNVEAADGYYRVQDRDLFRAVALAVDYGKVSEGTYDPTLGPVRRVWEQSAPAPPPADEIAVALRSVAWDAVVLERQLFAVRFLRPGMRLDLEGMVEGYAVDVASRKFVRTGSLAGVVRLDHHFYAWGHPPGREPWWVDVTDPRASERRPLVRVRIDASRGIGVTSAGGRGVGVLDPRTGNPAASDVKVAVVFADSVADAIAISRALVVGGSSRAGVMLEKTRRVEALLVVADEGSAAMLASASLAGRLAPADDSGGVLPIRFLLPPSRLKGRLE